MRPVDPAGNVTLDDISTMKSLVLYGVAYPRKRDGLLTGRGVAAGPSASTGLRKSPQRVKPAHDQLPHGFPADVHDDEAGSIHRNCGIKAVHKTVEFAGKAVLLLIVHICTILYDAEPSLENRAHAMTGKEFEKRVMRLGLTTGQPVRFDKHGKGSHGRLYYGTRFTTLKDRKKEIGIGLLKAMCLQLGISPDDL